MSRIFPGLLLCLVAVYACGSDGTSTPPADDTGDGGTSNTGGAGGTGGMGCTPAEEICDGLDNDCNGDVDEGCACVDGQTQECYSGDEALIGIGACARGTQTCDTSGSWGDCVDEVLPTQEQCDGADNDCNDAVDDGFGEVSCGLGICLVTVDECVDGAPNPCVPGPADPDESCDGLDNTCDGTIDEGCSCLDGNMQTCYSGSMMTQNVGLCSDGQQTCTNGQWGTCVGEVLPQTELCDDLDNNCDTVIDDNNPEGGGMCMTGNMGVCAAGILICETGGMLNCVQQVQAMPEICNGLDDDCINGVDDGDPGGGADCSVVGQMGICADGTEHCIGGNVVCQRDFPNAPLPEICNNLDDDCDGIPDDGNPGGNQMCNTGNPGICSEGVTDCMGGVIVCNQVNMPLPETCNGLDDDCMNGVDDGNPGGGVACNTGLQGVCAAGTTTCSMAMVQCIQDTPAAAEICFNAADEDCDGVLDNGCCGNGIIESMEACDDGNTGSGDGCSAACVRESGHCCSGEPSSCIASPVTVSADMLAVAIPDDTYNGTVGSMACVALDIQECLGTLTDVNVALGIDHTWVGDLTVRVISPANTELTLFHRPGHPAATFGDSSDLASGSIILFDGAAAVDPETMGSTIGAAQVVCLDDGVCSYLTNPDGEVGTNLAAFAGESVSGLWTVCVGDSAAGDTGSLEEVQFDFTFN